MTTLVLWLTAAQAWAEESGAEIAEHAGEQAHHAVTIPWMGIFTQAFNFFILVAILVYLLRKTVKDHFQNRAREYQQLVERAEAARAEAERGKVEIEQRLQKLQMSADQTLTQARAESEELKRRMMTEAQQLSARLEHEAQRTVAVEIEKAKNELRRELLEKGLAASKEMLSKQLGSSEQKKLNNEFAEKIQVVGG
jgi:F-type H+-transporting ATPase subunit b